MSCVFFKALCLAEICGFLKRKGEWILEVIWQSLHSNLKWNVTSRVLEESLKINIFLLVVISEDKAGKSVFMSEL